MPIRSQIRRDLHNHIDDKLYKWVKDSCALYEIADLEGKECIADIITSMFAGLGALAAAFDLEPNKIAAKLKLSLEISKRKHDQIQNQKESQS
jgi:hypothetical protein